MSTDIQTYEPKEIVASLEELSSGLSLYLTTLGLPAEAILVEIDERRQVINNMPAVVGALNPAQRHAAMYISKFVAACASGLFDAALNYLWDETIRNLRMKVARFDLDYFLDSVVTDPDRRSKFRDENDLDKLDDWVLIKGCRETGIIGDVGYRHLDFIRDMRNYASAAHPNHNELTGLQLAAWLQTCIREVLGKEPEGPAIEIRKLLRSLREEALAQVDVPPIASAVELLPDELSRSLLRTIFGMYTDIRLDARTRNNIHLIASNVWRVCSDDARYDASLKQASFSANGEVSRAKLAREFLELVNGLAYLPPDSLAVELAVALETLQSVHLGLNNFYNEPPHARGVQALVPASGDVPDSVATHYVKLLTMCSIGNGYGISWAAQPIYDDLMSRWHDRHLATFIGLVRDPEVASRLQFSSCAANYQALASRLVAQATGPHVKRALDFLSGFPTNKLREARNDVRFRELINTLGIK